MTRSLRKATALQLEPVVAREATAVSRVSKAKTYLSKHKEQQWEIQFATRVQVNMHVRKRLFLEMQAVAKNYS